MAKLLQIHVADELLADLDRMRLELADRPSRAAIIRRWIVDELEAHARKRTTIARRSPRKRVPVPWSDVGSSDTPGRS